MTSDAQEFITPLTLQTLTRNPVVAGLYDEKQSWRPGHIQLADSAGLLLNGLTYAWLGVRQNGGATQIVLTRCDTPAAKCKESVESFGAAGAGPVALRMQVSEGGMARFSYSVDRVNFIMAGEPFKASMGRWVGAQVGLFAVGRPGAFADVDYFRVTPPYLPLLTVNPINRATTAAR